jgi:hypothetical protein
VLSGVSGAVYSRGQSGLCSTADGPPARLECCRERRDRPDGPGACLVLTQEPDAHPTCPEDRQLAAQSNFVAGGWHARSHGGSAAAASLLAPGSGAAGALAQHWLVFRWRGWCCQFAMCVCTHHAPDNPELGVRGRGTWHRAAAAETHGSMLPCPQRPAQGAPGHTPRALGLWSLELALVVQRARLRRLSEPVGRSDERGARAASNRPAAPRWGSAARSQCSYGGARGGCQWW